MRIDAHHYLWRIERDEHLWLTPELPLYRNYEPDMLRPLLAAARIDGTLVIQAAPRTGETEYLLELAKNTPWILGVVGWLDFRNPDAEHVIDTLAEDPKLVGLRPMLQDLHDRRWECRTNVQRALHHMAHHELVLDVVARPDQIGEITSLAAGHRELSIVLNHAGKPKIGGDMAEWRRAIEHLALLPNVAVKLAGLLSEAPQGMLAEDLKPYFDALLNSFGSRRIIWGSDWPILDLRSSYIKWASIVAVLLGPLSEDERAAIMGENAARIYRVSELD